MIINCQYARHLNQSIVACHEIFRDMWIVPKKTSESLPDSGSVFFS